MPLEFRYSLTRICLRTGQLSLSQRMAELFPEAGKVRVLDTVDDSELVLEVEGPRKVSGIADFLLRHRLEVNDAVQIRVLEDGRIGLTAQPRRARRERLDEPGVAELLDSLVPEKPHTEAEIRALYPEIPAEFPLTGALAAHPRLRLRGGRWAATSQPAVDGETAVSRPPAPGSGSGRGTDDSFPPDSKAQESSAGRQLRRERRQSNDPAAPARRAAVTPYPRGVMFPGEAALNSKRPSADLKLVNRARDALTGFGYRVSGLPHGMLLARADLGRRQHSVLIRVVAEGERLDWAVLLARRREQAADHLAVFGDHRDLHRLSAPAELARATLWSWDGIGRVQSLATTVLIGPFDLEPHFVKGGMYGSGLQQFERSLSRMVADKGTLSAVLGRLAGFKAPTVFVLDDLLEADLQRDQVTRALDLLGQAPFHLVARVDRGEYCLRHSVAESLAHLSEYALSLQQRLPRAPGQLTGSPEDATA